MAGKPVYDRAVFRRLYDAGLSDNAISRALGCSVYVVTTWRNGAGLARHFAPIHGRKRNPKRRLILKLRRDGLTFGQIAKRVGCSRSTVAGAVHRHG